MSAFIVNPYHIRYLRTAADLWRVEPPAHEGQNDRPTLDEAFTEVFNENVKSVNARYNEDTEPRPEHTLWHLIRPDLIDPVQVIVGVHCLEYQSCEHRGWTDSYARKFLRQLEREACRHLPGYSEAQWEIADPSTHEVVTA